MSVLCNSWTGVINISITSNPYQSSVLRASTVPFSRAEVCSMALLTVTVLLKAAAMALTAY